MRNIIKIGTWFGIALAMLWPDVARCQAAALSTDSLTFSLLFRIDDDLLVRDYRSNKVTLDRMDRLLTNAAPHQVKSINIIGSASPNGDQASNRKCARHRAYGIQGYIRWKHPHVPQNVIKYSFVSNYLPDWQRAVEQDSNVPRRDKVIEILHSKASLSTKWANIKLLNGGAAEYMEREMLPSMRNAVTCVVTLSDAPAPAPRKQRLRMIVPIPKTQTEIDPEVKRLIAIYTAQAGLGTAAEPVEDSAMGVPFRLIEAADSIAAARADSIAAARADSIAAARADSLAAARADSLAAVPLEGIVTAGGFVDAATEVPSELNGAIELAPGSIQEVPLAMQPLVLTNTIPYTNKSLFALKTNLLFDAATLLNVEFEIPIGKRWSIAAEWMFPWWLWEKQQNCLQVMSGTVEGRYWFGDRDIQPNGQPRQQLTGWFVGLYAGGGYYDLEWERKGYQGEFFIAAGVSGGYAHTINKKGTLRMEYSLGVGYMQTNYRQYEAKLGTDNEWHLFRRANGKFTWFGPTRAKVSLVWMIDTNLFKKRGGRK